MSLASFPCAPREHSARQRVNPKSEGLNGCFPKLGVPFKGVYRGYMGLCRGYRVIWGLGCRVSQI